MNEFPQGDGKPDCPHCRGRGVVEKKLPGSPLGATEPCSCVWVRDIARNMERGWTGLLAADSVPDSVLKKFVAKNAWVTASSVGFKNHMKHVAGRMPATWNFLVITDADLMNAWLSPRLSVRDADIQVMRDQAEVRKYVALVDMTEPPDLLIITLGTKAARNEAMPEVLAEAVYSRAHKNKPTWIVDQPTYPFKEGHISYSQALESFIRSTAWAILNLETGTSSPEPLNMTPLPSVQEAPKPVFQKSRPPQRSKIAKPQVSSQGTTSMMDAHEVLAKVKDSKKGKKA